MSNGIKRAISLFLCVLMLFSLLPVDLAAENDENPQTVTVTFVINDSDYTQDPGSGYTHLTSNAEFSGGDLTYTRWAGRYQVGGTGTVCSVTVPTGTTLRENGLSAPAFSVENITNTNTNTYNSMRSWVSESGMVYTADTVFTEDTTLALSLYRDGENYDLDFVCCPEHNISINYYCGGLAPTFKLGNSLPQECFYDYDTINAHFPQDNHDLTHFSGWQLKNTATGEYVTLTGGMPITADYTDPTQFGNAVKVYAFWQEPPVTFTATFVNGETEVEVRTINEGDALGELPDLSDSAPEGQLFLGWQYTDANDNTALANASTVITADTVFTAVFGEADYCNVIFHDIVPDGTEIMSLDMSVPVGTALADLEPAVLSDGSELTDCRWYTVSGDTKTPVDFSTYTVNGTVNLYAYMKEASFTLEGQTEPVFTVAAREGLPLVAADFVRDGVDLCTYAWTYVDENNATQTLDMQSLIANGLTESFAATSDGTLNLPGVTANPNHQISYYVFIDGERVLLKTETVTSYSMNGNNRRYLTAATLEDVYGPYGFEASDLQVDTRYFPHVDHNKDTIWADTAVAVVDGYAFSPITNHNQPVDVYYLPNQSITTQQAKLPWQTVLDNGTDTFYTVRVQDTGELIYTEDEIPEPTYTLTGGTATMTVSNTPKTEGMELTWTCVGVDNQFPVEGVVNEDGTTTFVIENITQPYVITPAFSDNRKAIWYDINLQKLPLDAEYNTPTIEGGNVYNEFLESDAQFHHVLAPSLSSYLYKDVEKYLGKATFLGWAINGNADPEDLVQPGEVIDVSQYGSAITLLGQWKYEAGNRQNKTGPMVNFYVSLAAHPDEDDSWTGRIDSAQFTKSVYTDDCGVDAGIIPQKGDRRVEPYDRGLFIDRITEIGAQQYVVLGSTSGNDINERHEMIVRELSQGLTYIGNDEVAYTFQTSFPTDDMVMRNIREMIRTGTTITVNGHEITESEMTAENFSVRWYVFKYDTTDGWHIDGVLVSKVGTMTVTKTFDGKRELIDGIKAGEYSIDVAAEEGAVHTGENLTLENADSYDPVTDTYSWDIKVDQFYRYTLTENGYITDEHLSQTAASYNIRNSRLGDNTDGWQRYTSQVSVLGQSNRGGTQNLTVDFLNTYVPPGTLILRKLDKQTGNVIPQIQFDFTDSDGNTLMLQDKGNGFYDLVPSNDLNSVETSVVTTNSNGQAFLLLPPGTYKLRERVPDGYQNPGDIDFEMAYNPETQETEIHSAAAELDPDCVSISDEVMEVVVRNQSSTVNLKAKKIWEDEDNKPVTLRLYRKGEPLGEPVVLDGATDENEVVPWEYVFTDLPLYVGGEPAEYSILEERIGEFYYSSEFPDGYRYYDVTYEPIVYFDVNGEPTTDLSLVDTGILTVRNSRDSGTLIIHKVDENGLPLPGAVFKLYSSEGTPEGNEDFALLEDNLLQTVTSADNGDVDFGFVSDGTYYFIEYAAPQGYETSNALYRVRTANGVITTEQWDEQTGAWVSVADNKIVNRIDTAEVRIEKTVSGWLGDRSKDFHFYVTCSEPIQPGEGYTLTDHGTTASFYLSHGHYVTLKGVPIGAHLTIQEIDAEGYEMSMTVNEIVSQGALTVAEGMEILVNNQKEGRPDIGVVLDTLPYVLIILGIVAVAVIFIIRKRRHRDDE